MFKDFKLAIQSQFKKMLKNNEYLFVADVSKDEMWDLYLDSFPEGTNQIFRERREYDCQCCKQFIRNCGNLVSVKNNKLVSLWDCDTSNLEEKYQIVSKALSIFVKSKAIQNIFFNESSKVGTDSNIQLLDSGETTRWEHFYLDIPEKFVNSDPGSELSNAKSTKEVFKRSLEEISIDSIETVLELIEQNSLYRGEENKGVLSLFLDHKNKYTKLKEAEKDNYCWLESSKIGPVAKIRNTAIGTLLVDISDGKTLDAAVASFESKVAPINYKRPSAIVTKSMIENAQKKVSELGIEDSLSRRFAVKSDLTINNILFADRDTKKTMNVFDELKKNAPVKEKTLEKIEEVHIDDFIKNILPKASKIDVMPENSHKGNFVSLVAPKYKDSKNIFKWNNNFSWAYNGDVTDSIKEKVKQAGGNIDAFMRFSIHWFNYDDLDAHCVEPDGNEIYFGRKKSNKTNGFLDVDMNAGGGSSRDAVENIAFPSKERITDGKYIFLVENYRKRENESPGFEAEIEFNNEVFHFEYSKPIRTDEKVVVATIEVKNGKMKFIKSMPFSTVSKNIYGIDTNKFYNISMIMNSPNHWDGNETGNKHYFFMIEDCKNEENVRGFFNEFLNPELIEHRKVFEVLGSKMKVEKSEDQLSGVGFSSTQRNHLICKIHGSFTRTIKIIF